MARPKKKEKPAGKPVDNSIKAYLKIGGKTYLAEGKTIAEAVANLKPEAKKGIAVLALEKGGIRREKVLALFLTNRLFGAVSDFNREIAYKHLYTLFDRAFYESVNL